MSFSFHVAGHAGDGMEANGPEETAAVKELILEALTGAKNRNLNLTIAQVSPESFAPEGPLDTFHVT